MLFKTKSYLIDLCNLIHNLSIGHNLLTIKHHTVAMTKINFSHTSDYVFLTSCLYAGSTSKFYWAGKIQKTSMGDRCS